MKVNAVLDEVYIDVHFEVRDLARECMHMPEADTLYDIAAKYGGALYDKVELNSMLILLDDRKAEDLYRVLFYIKALRVVKEYDLFSTKPEKIHFDVYDMSIDTFEAISMYNIMVEDYEYGMDISDISKCMYLIVKDIIDYDKSVDLKDKLIELENRYPDFIWIKRLHKLVIDNTSERAEDCLEVILLLRRLILFQLRNVF